MGRENARAHARKISRAADWRAHWRQSRRARPRALHHDFRRSDSPPLHAGRSPRRLERRKISRLSRPAALHARHSRHRISRQALHHAAVLRLRLAGRNQPALQVSARTRRRRAFRGFRFAHADGLRLRPSRQRRRSRQVRRGHRFARRHGNSLRRHRSGKDYRFDDHQFAGVGACGPCIWWSPKSRARTGKRFPARSRTTF